MDSEKRRRVGRWCRRGAVLCACTLPVFIVGWDVVAGIQQVGLVVVIIGVVLFEFGHRLDPPRGGEQ